MARLAASSYLAFPFRIGAGGPATSDRARHVREQIEQVLFTAPGERVFRPEFGAGVRDLIFELNASALWQLTHKRLIASLTQALAGEVDPRTLEVEVAGERETLRIVISYELTTLGHRERHEIPLRSGGGTDG